jgi:TonB family protein
MIRTVSFAVSLLILALNWSHAVAAEASHRDASWYCHQGYLLVHRATGYSKNNIPTSWNPAELIKARDSFIECSRLATRDHDLSTRVMAVLGYGQAMLSLAQEADAFSVTVFVHHDRAPERTFRDFHEMALSSARKVLIACDTIDAVDVTTTFDDDYATKVQDSLRNMREAANDIKTHILATTLDGIPRNRAEYLAFVNAGRLPFYSVSQTMGLTAEERCAVKATPAEAIDFAASDAVDEWMEPQPATHARIEITVNPDGSLRAAHIAKSSGSSGRDADALARAYHSKYKAATRNCKSVPGSLMVEF